MKTTLYKAIIIAATFFQSTAKAQSYLEFSKYAGGSGDENMAPLMKVVNNETYLLSNTTSANFPVTNGSVYKGGKDMVLIKYGSNGAVLFATYIGGTSDENFQALTVNNNDVYISGYSTSANYPVTNSSVYSGAADIVITKINSSGNIVFSTYLGGNGDDQINSIFAGNKDLIIVGNEIFIGGSTGSTNFPHTTGGGYNGGLYDFFITKLNATTGAIIQSKLIGGSDNDNFRALTIENGSVFIVGLSSSFNIPTTIGTTYTLTPGIGEPYVIKLKSNDLSTVYSRMVGPNQVSFGFFLNMKVVNEELHLFGSTYSTNLPVTNGTTASVGSGADASDGFYIKLNMNGSIGFATYLGTNGNDYLNSIKITGGNVYLMGYGYNTDTREVYILADKINTNGSFGYNKKIKTGVFSNNAIYLGFLNFEEIAGELYIFGTTRYPELPITNSSQFNATNSGFFTHLNTSGDIIYSTFLGEMSSLSLMQYTNNKFYLLASSSIQTYPVSDSSKVKGEVDNLVIILNPDGSNFFSTYIGGGANENPTSMNVVNSDIYLSGVTLSTDYPVTQNILYAGNADMFLTKLSFCPDNYRLNNDTLSPKTQSVCKYGLAEKIIGQLVTVPGDSLPTTYLNGVAKQQRPIGTTYQWQVSTAASGPFINIPNAVFKDYTPVLGAVAQYYRRLAYALPECGGGLVHISDTAIVTVNSLTAPTLNLTGPYTTCPGTAITIGGSPTATGGNPPYTSCVWDNGLPAIPNPSVSPVLNTLYTLIVTDNLGCKQIGQSLVHTFKANAGLDKSNCAGSPVKIGTSQIIGVPGIIYNWQPAANLTNTAVAQPYANPSATTDYSLTLTVPLTGGGSCITKDTVTITPVAAPVTQNIAGPDRVICLNDTAYLGTPAEPGFNYVWSPGSYLTSNTTSLTKYYPGNILMPYPNTATINLTAQKGTCFFTDKVEVSTIESRAGFRDCGPRIVGLPDRTPDIGEKYQWTLVSGPGNFTGPTNQPQVPVSASIGGESVYGLTVSYRGGSCYSEVTVPEACEGCDIIFTVDAKYQCPGYDVNFGNVAVTAWGNLQDGIYSWEPKQGLSNYTGATVHLTDNVPRTYYVTVTSASDPNIRCTDSIKVNDPAFSRPVFEANDTVTCVNQPVTIGATNVAGFSYLWNGAGLSDNSISNPVATVPYYAEFTVIVSDGNGCILKDTVAVNVETVNRAAGEDWVICSNGIVKLGSAPQPNISYLWEPQIAPWQNGTNQFSAQPEILVATDVTFHVSATTPAGCIIEDDVNVVVNNSPVIADAPDVIVCKDKTAVIGSTALPGVTYQWSPAEGLNDATLAQPTVAPLANAVYSVQATFPGGCALPATDNVTVTISDAAFTMPDIVFCPSAGPVSLGITAPANMSQYIWLPNYNISGNPFIANPVVNNPSTTAPTTYTLTVINNNGCVATDTILIIPALSPVFAGNDKVICKNTSTVIGSADNITGTGISYQWSSATNLSNINSITPVFTGTDTGTFTYYLTKTTSNPVCSAIDSVKIKVEELSLPSMSTPTICKNSCVEIGTTPIETVQYQWAPSSGLSNPNIANPIVCVDSQTVTYQLTASTTSGCSANSSVLVTVTSAPAAQINLPPVVVCMGATTAKFEPVITPSGPYSYLWSPNDGSLNDITIKDPFITVTETGTKQYNLQVTDTVTGCNSATSANITVNTCSTVGSVGDFVWFDINGNGLQDVAEPGVSNVMVKLYNSVGYNVATASTDADGYFSFANITPGEDYYLIFSKPEGYSFTLQNIGGAAAANNSKADNTGHSNNFSVIADNNISTIDAGIIPTGNTPVTLLSFTGKLKNNIVLLNWQTSAEYNNHYFDVERSSDGINFTTIGRIDGNGTTSLPHSYSFIDAHPLNGANYYRLRQADFDGHSTYSLTLKIITTISPVIAATYQRSNNSIQVTLNKPQSTIQLQLFAANGQLVKQGIVTNTNNYLLKLPLLADGMYMLQVLYGSNIYVQKILIDK